MSDGKNILESSREILQDFVVPELKSVKTNVESLRTELHIHTQAIREEMRLSVSAIREELKLHNQALREEMKLRQETVEQAIRGLSGKLDDYMDIRERIAQLEARLPRQ